MTFPFGRLFNNESLTSCDIVASKLDKNPSITMYIGPVFKAFNESILLGRIC